MHIETEQRSTTTATDPVAFANSGDPIPSPAAAYQAPTASLPDDPHLRPMPVGTSAAVPHAQFTTWALSALVCSGALTFVAADDFARSEAYLIPFALFLVLALAVSAWRMRFFWQRLGSFGTEALVRGKLRRGLVVFLTLTVSSMAFVGLKVGSSGAETEAYLTDRQLYETLGRRISAARNTAGRTIAAKLDMYAKIEPDVIAFGPVLHRLQVENSLYASKYPAAQAMTSKSGANFENTARRMTLLLQQIAVAKRLKPMQDQEEQSAMWRESMSPLLRQEDELDRY